MKPLVIEPVSETLPDWDLYRALREQWTHEDSEAFGS
jgi:hypothetical protein